jgi:hypothetical protein
MKSVKTRVMYEKEHNLVAEADVASRYADTYGLEAVKRKEFDHFDYDMLTPEGEKVATVEIKCRADRFLPVIESGGYMISAGRYNNQLRVEQEKGIPIFLLVGIANDIYILPIEKTEPLKAVVGGRTQQTRDEYDIETVVYIPWGWFMKLGEEFERKQLYMGDPCGRCGHQTDDHVEGKSGWGCRPCYISEQNDRTRITDAGFFKHEFTEFNQLGNKVL